MPFARIVAVGEAMIELTAHGADWRMGYGGDTLNMAIHCARLGFPTRFLTALGADPFSAQLRTKAWPAEGLDTSLILVDQRRQPGLYAITTDAQGERNFTYWRSNSAASRLFDHTDIAERVEGCTNADLLFYSLISLAILPEAGRLSLLALAQKVRDSGGLVAFDGNYRASLWNDATVARRWRDAALEHADIGLPTLADEIELGGADNATDTIRHWRSAGASEVVVKLGPDGCILSDGTVVPPPARLAAVDTSGAGDAFNAGYLTARLRGDTPLAAAGSGHTLAGWTLLRTGAIPPRDDLAPYPVLAPADVPGEE